MSNPTYSLRLRHLCVHILTLFAISTMITFGLLSPRLAAAACTPLPTTLGTVTFTVSVPAAGTYRFWAHAFSPSANNDALYMQIDQTHCQITVGDTSIPAGQFKWVDYQNGSTSNKINLTLTAGSHAFTLAGLDPSVGVDKIILAADSSCVPAGDGENCTTTQSGTGSIITPPANTKDPSGSAPSVTGTISLPGAANGNTVRYYLDGKPVEGDKLDTTTLSDGKYTLKRVETDTNGEATETVQEIVVDNHKSLSERVTAVMKHPLSWGAVALLLLAGAVFAVRALKPQWTSAISLFLQSKILRRPLPGPQPSAEGVVVYTAPSVAKHRFRKWLFILGFALIGATTLLYTFAATNSISYLTWNGIVTNGASIVSKTGAIGGKMVQFAASTPTQQDPPPPANSCPNAKHTPGGPDGFGGCWPYAGNTGVPAGTALTSYTGPCTITTNNLVIDAKTINCDLQIRAANVIVKNSKINGSIATDENSTTYSFSISDSEVDVGNRSGTGVGAVNFTATRVHVYGGNRSMHCFNACTITDSYVHGQYKDLQGLSHESGMRMGQSATIRHNSILCDAPDVPPDAGCSADLTGYGDFAPVQNNTIERNLFLATTGGYCAYGGSSQNKAYSGQTRNITFKDNVFQKGTRPGDHGKPVCGYYGAITSFVSTEPGNVWSNNKWDDGTVLPPDN